jgi:hypothetical protein
MEDSRGREQHATRPFKRVSHSLIAWGFSTWSRPAIRSILVAVARRSLVMAESLDQSRPKEKYEISSAL